MWQHLMAGTHSNVCITAAALSARWQTHSACQTCMQLQSATAGFSACLLELLSIILWHLGLCHTFTACQVHNCTAQLDMRKPLLSPLQIYSKLLLPARAVLDEHHIKVCFWCET